MKKKIAVVTGGAGDIGKVICKKLIGANYSVRSLDVVTAEYSGITSHICDVTDAEEVRLTLEGVEVDVLVNAAGITRDNFLHKMSVNDWNMVMEINLNGTFNVTRAVIEGMRERKYGRIVNISSVNGQKGQMGQCNYSATKAAVHGITMSLAQEGARKNILVNTVSPGYIDTQMTAKISENVRNMIVNTIPVGHMGKPEDVARAVMFLASESNRYITGANIPVNGGLFTSF
jgi:acetoacetyl-CoA reductase